MQPLRFHPAARAELIDVILQLEADRPGHGNKLLAELEGLLERIGELPRSGASLAGYPPELDVRVFPLRTFRYSLIVAAVDGGRVIHAFAHQRRRPRYWADRIR
jgi:plasmid stabilization system protein ParE